MLAPLLDETSSDPYVWEVINQLFMAKLGWCTNMDLRLRFFNQPSSFCGFDGDALSGQHTTIANTSQLAGQSTNNSINKVINELEMVVVEIITVDDGM